MPTVYILLPVHNRKEVTKKFIGCLRLQTYTDYHLILLDDGSSDGTSEMVKEWISELTVLHGKGDWWWGGALHQGYLWLRKRRVAGDAIVLMMNDDTEFDKDFIANGVSFLEKHQRTLLMAECYDVYTRSLIDRGVHVDWERFTFQPAGSTKQVNCLATRGLFLRMSDFLEIGGFRPKLIPHYLSDYEFTMRGYIKGIQLCTTPSVMLWLNGDSTGLQRVVTANIRGFVKSLFSLRSANHLRSWTFFIVLACPLRWIPLNLVRTYIHACKAFHTSIRSSLFGIRDKGSE